MAESTLSIGYDELLVIVGGFLGYSTDSDDWTESQLAEVDGHIQSGIRRYYYPPAIQGLEPDFEWSFLNPTTTLATTADDGAQDLPDEFGRLISRFSFDPDDYYPDVIIVSEADMQTLLARSDDTGRPQYAAIRYKAGTTETEGQRLEVVWYPIPDDEYTLTYRYEAYSGKLTESLPYPLGGMKHSELIIESCLAVAEERSNDESGLHNQRFREMLVSSAKRDGMTGAKSYGNMGGCISSSEALYTQTFDISYNGDVIT